MRKEGKAEGRRGGKSELTVKKGQQSRQREKKRKGK